MLAVHLVHAQTKFTAYDDLPNLNKSCKPAYDNNYPAWAKMLYQYPVNFFEINEKFEQYEKKMNFKGEEGETPHFKIF